MPQVQRACKLLLGKGALMFTSTCIDQCEEQLLVRTSLQRSYRKVAQAKCGL